MRTTTRLNIVHQLGVRWVGDVVYSNAFLTHCALASGNPLHSAVDAATPRFVGYEQQVSVDGRIRLIGGADIGTHELWRLWIGDVPDHEAAEIPLIYVMILERDIRVD